MGSLFPCDVMTRGHAGGIRMIGICCFSEILTPESKLADTYLRTVLFLDLYGYLNISAI